METKDTSLKDNVRCSRHFGNSVLDPKNQQVDDREKHHWNI